MSDDTTSVDDLFAPDDDTATADGPGVSGDYPGNVAEFKAAAPDLPDAELERLLAEDTRIGVRDAAKNELDHRAQPADDEPVADDDLVDNAVRIRRLDWECVCGNTNTLDLQRCGKCRQHRFTAN